jgi:hypothetical protein
MKANLKLQCQQPIWKILQANGKLARVGKPACLASILLMQ